MARPTKTGLDYYPMDVGFLRDKKVRLLRSEFGASSVIFVLYVLGKVYEGEGYSAHITGEDCSGNALTKEEYENFADTYYGNMGLTKKMAAFKWIDVKTLEGMSDEEVEKLLTEAYEGFSME